MKQFQRVFLLLAELLHLSALDGLTGSSQQTGPGIEMWLAELVQLHFQVSDSSLDLREPLRWRVVRISGGETCSESERDKHEEGPRGALPATKVGTAFVKGKPNGDRQDHHAPHERKDHCCIEE